MAGDSKKIMFDDIEIDEMTDEQRHTDIKQLLMSINDELKKDDGEEGKIALAIEKNAGQLGRFVEAIKNIKFDVPAPQVTVGSPNVSVDVKQEEVVSAIKGIFDEMKEFLTEVKTSTEKLSQDVRAMNESYRADKVMNVSWYSGMVDKITVTIKK